MQPQDIRSLDDLARLPLLDKPTLRAAYPDDALAANADRRQLVRYASSGSTGEPLQFVMTRAEKGQRWAVMFRSWAMAGAYQGMRAANIKDGHALGVFRSGPLQRLEQQATRMLNLSAYAVHDQRLEQVVSDLVRFRPEVMFAYPGTAWRLAVALAERGIDLPLRAVITSGEMLHPFQRQAIEQQFRCRVHDYYGGEGMDVAMQCGVGSTYHINAESVIVEVVDADGQPVPAGQEGSIVLTNLHAYAMPFIRYVVGDVGALAAGQCACGRGLPLLDHVAGRSSDQLTLPSGRGLSCGSSPTSSARCRGCSRSRCARSRPIGSSSWWRQGRPLATCRPTPASGRRAALTTWGAFVGPDAALQFLRQRLEEQVRGEAALDIALVEAIPLGPGGKHRFFVDAGKKPGFSEKTRFLAGLLSGGASP